MSGAIEREQDSVPDQEIERLDHARMGAQASKFSTPTVN